MKTMKLNAFAVAGLLTLSTITGFAQNEVSASAFQKDKADIKEDISNISYRKSHIISLTEKVKSDKSNGNELAVIKDQKELMRTKADLMRDKMYLMTDKCDLKKDHKLAIKNQKELIKKDEANLKESRNRLKNGTSAESNASVTRYENELARHKTELKEVQKKSKADMTAVNDEIKKSYKESASMKHSEKTSTAKKDKPNK